MQTFLITGATHEERLKEALKRGGDVKKEDLVLLETEVTFGIEDVRDLKHQLFLKPYASKNKVAIICDAEKLTFAAQNAFLKTLEEPPEDTILILTTSSKDLLLPTILSRCQIVELPTKTVAEFTEKGLEEQLATVYLQLSSDTGDRVWCAARNARNREETVDFLDKQTIIWRKILLQKIQISQSDEPSINLSIKQIARILREIQKTRKIIKANVNPRLALDIFLLNLPEFP